MSHTGSMETPPQEQYHTNMTLRRSTRSALAEIPTRLSLLTMGEAGRVMGTPGGNESWTSLNINVNLPSSYMSPAPSPDELVIQQRGRRRGPVTWSPDIDAQKQAGAAARSGAEARTPSKCPNSPSKSSIVLRSTPRKRLLLTDPKELFSTPEKIRKMSPCAKKSRTEKPAANYSGPLQLALKGLSTGQLVDILQELVTNHPNLEEEIREILPTPDLRPLEDRLGYLKKNIFKSLPNSRLTSKTDSPAFSRAATHVVAFKKCVLEQGRQLVESQHWGAVLDYVVLAWSYVRATPLWDNPPHNATRRQCFKFLAAQCMTALKKGFWTPAECDVLVAKLEGLVADTEDIQMCIKQLDVIRKSQ